MNQHVIHLCRWLLPFTASFIRNQVLYHRRYRPGLVYLQRRQSAFYDEIVRKVDTFYPFRSRPEELLYQKARLLLPAVRRRIGEHLRTSRPDVLHVHYGVDCLVYSDLLRELAIPTCVSFYGYDCTSFPRRFYGYGQSLLQQKVFANPAVRAVLAMSEDMRDDLVRLGCPEHKIIVHYYGIETGPFYQERIYEDREEVRLLIISGLYEKKGHDVLLDALKQSRGRRLRLDIVGEGPGREALQRRIKNEGFDNVTLHGSVRYGSEEHLDYLRRADIFVHPSLTPANGDKEGIPGALVEAMAAGLPVVSTYHAGIPSVIESERTGLLVPERNAATLATAIGRLADDVSLRRTLGRQGQQHAREELDITIKEKELEGIYDELCRKKLTTKGTKITEV